VLIAIEGTLMPEALNLAFPTSDDPAKPLGIAPGLVPGRAVLCRKMIAFRMSEITH
jgi:hypothetical protein